MVARHLPPGRSPNPLQNEAKFNRASNVPPASTTFPPDLIQDYSTSVRRPLRNGMRRSSLITMWSGFRSKRVSESNELPSRILCVRLCLENRSGYALRGGKCRWHYLAVVPTPPSRPDWREARSRQRCHSLADGNVFSTGIVSRRSPSLCGRRQREAAAGQTMRQGTPSIREPGHITKKAALILSVASG